MRTPLLLFLLSLGYASGLYILNGPGLTLPLAVAALSAIAALILLGHAVRRWKRDHPTAGSGRPVQAKARPRRTLRAALTSARPHVVIDGSNVMHWNAETPRIETVVEVVRALRAQGYQPGVIFDANAGYKFGDRYLDDRHFAKLLKLPTDRVLVVPKGVPADPTILAAARELGAKVVTNDRYRDWVGDYPEVVSSGHLVKGGYRDGKLWLEERALWAAA